MEFLPNYLSEIFDILDEDFSMSQFEKSSIMTFKKIRGEIEEKSLFTNQSFLHQQPALFLRK